MPTIAFSLSDEDVERVADRVLQKLEAIIPRSSPSKPKPVLNDSRMQVGLAEAARMLGCSSATLYRLVQRGLIHPNRATRRYLFPIKELERFIAECSSAI